METSPQPRNGTSLFFTALRGEETLSLLAQELQVGDIVTLNAGDTVPADMEIVSGHCLNDASFLNGKTAIEERVPGDTLYAGTQIPNGSCQGKVVAVGVETHARKLTASVKAPRRIIKTFGLPMIIIGISVICAAAYALLYVFSAKAMGLDAPILAVVLEAAALPLLYILCLLLTISLSRLATKRKGFRLFGFFAITRFSGLGRAFLGKKGVLTDDGIALGEVIPIDGQSETEMAFGISAILAATKEKEGLPGVLGARFGRRNKTPNRCHIPFGDGLLGAVTLQDGETYVFGPSESVCFQKAKETELLLKSYAKQQRPFWVLAHSENPIRNGVLPRDFELFAIVFRAENRRDGLEAFVQKAREFVPMTRVVSGDSSERITEAMNGIDLPISGNLSPEDKKSLVAASQQNDQRALYIGALPGDSMALRQADASLSLNPDLPADCVYEGDLAGLSEIFDLGEGCRLNLRRVAFTFLTLSIAALLIGVSIMSVMFLGRSLYVLSLVILYLISLGLAIPFGCLIPFLVHKSTRRFNHENR